METSYEDYVRQRAQKNPCLNSLVDYLQETPGTVCKGYLMFTDSASVSACHFAADMIPEISRPSPVESTRLVLMENIHSTSICQLGEQLGIDPMFFAGHVTTDLQDMENALLPPSLTTLPSTSAERGYINIHYQQVLDLGSSALFEDAPCSLKTDDNISRNVRLLPPLSGKQIGLVQSCCSIIVKKIGNVQIGEFISSLTDRKHKMLTLTEGLILVDPPINRVYKTTESGSQQIYDAKRLHGGLEDFTHPATFDTTADQEEEEWDNSSIRDCLMQYVTFTPGILRPTKEVPFILDVAYFPVRIILNEWNTYAHLTTRYLKYFEVSMNDITSRLRNDDMIDLQSWRRRNRQSQHQLIALAEFLDYHRTDIPRESQIIRWALIVKDIRYMSRQMETDGQSLEQMISAATSMVQLLDAIRSILEAINMRRLTSIALLFIPLSWLAYVFSMSGQYLPGNWLFLVYLVLGLPVLGAASLFTKLPINRASL
ncbi:Zinc transport protein ZntB [Fusarium austroafricanum]|uniref:Zinc transport protein ZntB n=1 Tax=Fusarium austroafricanum TaxID=2364996 RepID=A0A8H4NS09_9HYPO|nr:Zinc transport protein ZntB [Fusarium austroafricanum]